MRFLLLIIAGVSISMGSGCSEHKRAFVLGELRAQVEANEYDAVPFPRSDWMPGLVFERVGDKLITVGRKDDGDIFPGVNPNPPAGSGNWGLETYTVNKENGAELGIAFPALSNPAQVTSKAGEYGIEYATIDIDHVDIYNIPVGRLIKFLKLKTEEAAHARNMISRPNTYVVVESIVVNKLNLTYFDASANMLDLEIDTLYQMMGIDASLENNKITTRKGKISINDENRVIGYLVYKFNIKGSGSGEIHILAEPIGFKSSIEEIVGHH